jgi:hypothetical protein
MATSRAVKYRKKVEECRVLAGKAKLHEVKKSWLKLALQWERLAQEVDSPGQQAQQLQSKGAS